MFDIGFWELVIITIIALIVVGPERLPKFARDAGHFISKVRRFVHNAKKELEKELHLDEVNNLQDDIRHIDSLMKEAPDRVILDEPTDNAKHNKPDE
jgi:sec-independent protein translocase protein TatB